MSTITTINGSDVISTSRTDINTNFANLNDDKIETSVISTDNTFAGASDAKIPSQLAVKTYVDAGGNINASETTKGIVQEATDAQVTAGTDTGSTGAKLFVPPSKLTTRVNSLIAAGATVYKNGATTYDISTASGVQNIPHGLGVSPKQVKLYAVMTGTRSISNTNTIYNGTTQSSLFWTKEDTTEESGALFRLIKEPAVADYASGVITFDATNIIITWTKTGTPTGTANIIWEATV